MKSMTKRLFIFAGYDANGIIDDALIHYVRALSRHGDIVLCMDSDCKKSELDKIKPFVLVKATDNSNKTITIKVPIPIKRFFLCFSFFFLYIISSHSFIIL